MPKRNARALTDVQLRAWLNAGEPLAKADGDGLTFTLSGAGVATWVQRYRIGGRRKEVTLGRYPDLSLTEARKRAAAARLEIANGTDVALAKRREKSGMREARTVKDLVRSYEERVLPHKAATTITSQSGYFRNALLPEFGTWPADSITPKDVVDWLTKLKERRSYSAASNARKAAISVFNYALIRHEVATNPFAVVRMKAVGEAPATRERVMLSLSQVKRFMAGLVDLPERDALVYSILLATGVRAGELFGAEWADLDLSAAQWRIPRHKIKTRKTMERAGKTHFIVPLAPPVIGWFSRLRQIGDGSSWVVFPMIPSRARGGPADYERTLDRMIAYAESLGPDFPRITFHDLRSTFRSHLTDTLDVRFEVAERMLNHQLPGLGRIYDKSDYLDQREDALSRWASILCDGAPTKVRSLQSVRRVA